MLVPAPIVKRILAGVIDYAVLMLIAIVLALIFGTDWRYATFFTFAKSSDVAALTGVAQAANVVETAPTIIFTVVFLGYFIAFETIGQTSIGKNLMRLTLVKESGAPIGLREAIIRTLLRPLDGSPMWYIMGLIAIALSPARQRIGDHLAQAVVVENSEVSASTPQSS